MGLEINIPTKKKNPQQESGNTEKSGGGILKHWKLILIIIFIGMVYFYPSIISDLISKVSSVIMQGISGSSNLK